MVAGRVMAEERSWRVRVESVTGACNVRNIGKKERERNTHSVFSAQKRIESLSLCLSSLGCTQFPSENIRCRTKALYLRRGLRKGRGGGLFLGWNSSAELEPALKPTPTRITFSRKGMKVRL